MEHNLIFFFTSTLLLLLSLSAHSQTASPPSLSPTPTPAPAPAPDHVNLTNLLAVAGPFQTFLRYLQFTQVINTFQKQANGSTSKEGITIFAPKDEAFSSLKKPSLSNLTKNQLKSLLLFHALPHYYSLADFDDLSQKSPVASFAGGLYTLNFTDVSGTVHVSSGWTHTRVSSSVLSTDPVAVYQVDRVLLPEAIFGTDIPPAPAPVPSPDEATAADTPSAVTEATASSSAAIGSPSSSSRISGGGIWSHLILTISGGLLLSL